MESPHIPVIRPTKAGWRLLWGSGGLTFLITCFTARWALEFVDKGVQRMSVWVYISLLAAIMGITYLSAGWCCEHARFASQTFIQGQCDHDG